MNYKVEISAPANADLRNIYKYIAFVHKKSYKRYIFLWDFFLLYHIPKPMAEKQNPQAVTCRF